MHATNTLIEDGQSVILFYSASAPLGGKWTSGGNDLYIEKGKAYLEGYASDISFEVGDGVCIHDKYPLGWTALGRKTAGDTDGDLQVKMHQKFAAKSPSLCCKVTGDEGRVSIFDLSPF